MSDLENKIVLTVGEPDTLALKIAGMWSRHSTDRETALKEAQEARDYVFATDIDKTTGTNTEHKNRTHLPKLTQIADTLQSKYFEATLNLADFFGYVPASKVDPEDARKAKNVAKLLQLKLEQKKFRETEGRKLLADFVIYGNCFCGVEYITEADGRGGKRFKGTRLYKISPFDIVFNPFAESFDSSFKIIRKYVHISQLLALPTRFPNAGFDKRALKQAAEVRKPVIMEEWSDYLRKNSINFDGFNTQVDYFGQDMVEVLVYKGDVFNPETNVTELNREVLVVDRSFIILNQPIKTPMGGHGVYHAGWRIRPDNLWAQSPLANLVGMQYRIDHLENLKADVFDQIAEPQILIKGEDVQAPDVPRPGEKWYLGVDCDVKFLVPDTTALNADTQINIYSKMMEDFVGVPPEASGVRSPGEKTAFEVDTLNSNSVGMFTDKAGSFERMLESVLMEALDLTVLNFDEAEYITIFDDITGAEEIAKLSVEDIAVRGSFSALGSKYWARKRKAVSELRSFMQNEMQDPKVRAHVSGFKLAQYLEDELDLEDVDFIEQFAGVKEDVELQAVAQAEQQRISEESGTLSPEQAALQQASGVEQLQPGLGNAKAGI